MSNAVQDKIVNYIIRQVEGGELKSGDKIPTEMVLAEMFNTNRSNVHRAVKKLEEQKIVTRNKRQGTLVNSGVIDKIKLIRLDYSDQIYVCLSEKAREYVYWSGPALDEFETILAKQSIKAIFKEVIPDRAHLAVLIEETVVMAPRALVFLSFTGNLLRIMLENRDVISNYNGEIYVLARGGVPINKFPWHVISFNHYEDGFKMGKYIIEKKFRKVAYLDSGEYWSGERREGVGDAIKLFGNGMELNVLNDRRDGFEKVVEYIINCETKPCIVARNDINGAEFIDFAAKQSMNAPVNFALVSFSASDSQEYRRYNMTTMVQQHNKLGKTLAAAVLNSRNKLRDGVKMIYEIEANIIERETC